MSILPHIRDVLAMLGGTADLADDPRLSTVEALLDAHGLRLVVAPEDSEPAQLPSRFLVQAAIRRAIAAGEPEKGLLLRAAMLCGRDKAAITRVVGSGAEMSYSSREALEAHLRDPVAHPLPQLPERLTRSRNGTRRKK